MRKNDKMTLVKKEFSLDAQIQKRRKVIEDYNSGIEADELKYYMARNELSDLERRIRQVQCRLYGWRHFAEMDPSPELNALRKQVIDLETMIQRYRNVLDNYPQNVKNREDIISNLQSKLGAKTGYVPSDEEIEKERDTLLEVHKEAGNAEAALPGLVSQLEKAKKELEKVESGKGSKKTTHSVDYASPDKELDARAKTYSLEHKVSYEDALQAVMKEDPYLAKHYIGV